VAPTLSRVTKRKSFSAKVCAANHKKFGSREVSNLYTPGHRLPLGEQDDAA
jgi:hypothetical protein